MASDGTVITEAKDYHSYKQEGTTNYIVIDTESDYVLEGWKASSTNRELNIKDNFYSISATQSGDSAEEIEIDVDNGVKYVYLLFKKTEVNPNPAPVAARKVPPIFTEVPLRYLGVTGTG